MRALSPRVTFIWQLGGLAPPEGKPQCARPYFPAPGLNAGFGTRALHEDPTLPAFCCSTHQLSTETYVWDNSEQEKQIITTNNILVCDVADTVPSAWHVLTNLTPQITLCIGIIITPFADEATDAHSYSGHTAMGDGGKI